MTVTVNDLIKGDAAASVVTRAGAGAKILAVNGTKPAAGGALTGGNTVLSTGTFGSTIGTSSAAGVDIDEAGITQTPASNVAGTPTFFRITTSANAFVADIDVGAGAGSWQFTGTVAVGQALTYTGLTIPVV